MERKPGVLGRGVGSLQWVALAVGGGVCSTQRGYSGYFNLNVTTFQPSNVFINIISHKNKGENTVKNTVKTPSLNCCITAF